MSRKPNGGKVGRPTRKLGDPLTIKQIKFLELLLKSPDHSQSWYAQKVGVTRQTMSEWCRPNSLMMQEGGQLQTRNYQQIARVRGFMRGAAGRNISSISSNSPQFTKEANIRRWVNEVWNGPFTLPGSEIVMETSEDYVAFMLEKRLAPSRP